MHARVCCVTQTHGARLLNTQVQATTGMLQLHCAALCKMKGGDGGVSGISLLKSTHPKRNDRAVAEATAVVRHRRSSMAFQALLFLVQALGNYLSPSR